MAGVDVGKRIDQRSLGVEDEAVEIKDEGVNHAANGIAMWVGQVTLVDARSLSAGRQQPGKAHAADYESGEGVIEDTASGKGRKSGFERWFVVPASAQCR
jgi:hypothetical protein